MASKFSLKRLANSIFPTKEEFDDVLYDLAHSEDLQPLFNSKVISDGAFYIYGVSSLTFITTPSDTLLNVLSYIAFMGTLATEMVGSMRHGDFARKVEKRKKEQDKKGQSPAGSGQRNFQTKDRGSKQPQLKNRPGRSQSQQRLLER